MGESTSEPFDWTRVPMIRRRALVDRWRSRAAGVTTILAPDGFGKSAFAYECLGATDGIGLSVSATPGISPSMVLGRLEEAARTRGLTDVALALAADEARVAPLAGLVVTIVVDDCHFLPPGSSPLLDAALRLLPDGRLILAGHGLEPRLAQELPADRLTLGPLDLAFTLEEIRELYAAVAGTDAAPEWAEVVLHLTRGWPAAVAVAVLGSAEPDPRRRTRRESATLDMLLSLPLLSDKLVGELTGDADFLARVGVRLGHRGDGWIEVPAARRRHATINPQVRRLAALHYSADGHHHLTLDLYADHLEELPGLLSEIPLHVLTAFPVERLLALVAAVPDDAARELPLTLPKVSRSIAPGWFVAERLALVDRAQSLIGHRHPAVEAARCQLLSALDERAALRSVATALANDPDAAGSERSLGLVALASDLAVSQRVGDILSARPLLLEAQRLLGTDLTPARGDIADVLGLYVEVPLGHYAEAVEILWRMVSGLEPTDLKYPILVGQWAVATMVRGGPVQAEPMTAELAAARDRIPEAINTVTEWTSAWLAAAKGDHAQVRAALRRAFDTDGWVNRHSLGMYAYADAAVLWATIGDRAEADACVAALARHARAQDADRAAHRQRAEAAIAARFGDPADCLPGLLARTGDPDLAPTYRISALVQAAWAAHRGGDDSLADRLLTDAAAQASRLGNPNAVGAIDLDLFAWAHGRLGDVETLPASLLLFGTPRVARWDQVEPLPPGQASELVAHLAWHGPMDAARVAARLWPNAAPELARSRLRNLLNRLRSGCGPLVVRAGATLMLAPGTMCDVTEFRRRATEALRDHGSSRGTAIRLALLLRTGPALLGIQGEWADAARDELTRLAVALLDARADLDLERHDLDDAVRALRLACDLDPDEPERLTRLASSLRRLGRAAASHEVDEQARRALASLRAEGPGVRAASTRARAGSTRVARRR